MREFNLIDYGVIPNAKITQTKAIQAAIDAAQEANGTVVVPCGMFITGTLNIKSVSICMEKGAIIKGSDDFEDYSWNGFNHNEMGDCLSLLYSLEESNLHIYGEGVIDFNGSAFYDMDAPLIPETLVPMSKEQIAECCVGHKVRPNQPIFIYKSNNICIEDITILDAPCWTMSFIECENIHISNLTIKGHPLIPNNDGMHFCGCDKVFVTGCNIDTADDCIALSCITDWNKPCQNIVISDCILRSFSKAISIGYMHSIIRNVTITNCVINDSNRAVSIMSSQGSGIVENITITNLVIDTRVRAGNWWGNGEPILIMATYHHNYQNEVPRTDVRLNVRDVHFNNIICHSENAIGLIGVDNNISNVSFRDVTVYLKESDNINLKGNTFDLAPSMPCDTIPSDGEEYVFVSRNATNIYLDHVVGYTKDGNLGKIFQG